MCAFCNGLVSSDRCGFVLLMSFVGSGFRFSVPSQQIGWEERLPNGLFRVQLDVKP